MDEPKDFTNTVEFQDAVNKAAEAAAAKIMAAMATKISAAPQGPDQNFAEQLALAIAQIADQDTNRKRVPPEEIARRNAARDRMHELIQHARATGQRPEYRLIAKVYLSERFIEPFTLGDDKKVRPTEILWPGVPNEAMQPLNDCSKEIFAAFKESIGGQTGRVKGESTKGHWITPGGVVVKGDAPRRRAVGDGQAPEDYFSGDDVMVKNDDVGSPNDPTATHVRVLGTIAAPARQGSSQSGQGGY